MGVDSRVCIALFYQGGVKKGDRVLVTGTETSCYASFFLQSEPFSCRFGTGIGGGGGMNTVGV